MVEPELVQAFEAAGGRFITAARTIANKLEEIRAVVFDWDGVFNDGRKGTDAGSGFSEADSMGTNMLRYGLWRTHGDLPVTAIISGENNASAVSFAEREHLHGVYTGMRDKKQVIGHICHHHGVEPGQIACVFDDINDLPMADICGLRLQVRRSASPLFARLCEERGACDYLTGAESGRFAVREICELLLGLMDVYDDVVGSRVEYDKRYGDYFSDRQSVPTGVFGQDGGAIVSRDD